MVFNVYSCFPEFFGQSFLELVSEGIEEEDCHFFFVGVDEVLPEVSLVYDAFHLPFLLFFDTESEGVVEFSEPFLVLFSLQVYE